MYSLLRPLLFRLDPERAHHLAQTAARIGQTAAAPLLARAFAYEHPSLRRNVFGHFFDNPVGLAAGFDKDARLVPFWELLGFGFAEVGSVSARPSAGNPKPRLFRLPADHALVNRMGLNNEGAEAVATRLRALRRRRPLGINLVKTHDPALLGRAAIDDFRASFRRLAPLATYVVLNISCPNTAEGKTFETPEALDALLTAIAGERRLLAAPVPLLVKLSPPPADGPVGSLIDELVVVAHEHGVDGFVATNTAPDRAGLHSPAAVLEGIGRGGLSGAPLEARALGLVRHLRRRTERPIIGVGGIGTAAAAYARIRAGASLVQLYTGLVYEGPAVVRRIKEGLVRLLAADGYASVADATGVDAG